MSEPAVVIGNGPSREGVDLEAIPYTTFGCNGIIDDFRPDYLLCGDRWALDEMRERGWPNGKQGELPHEHQKFEFGSCGGAALYAALSMGYSPVYLIGFDGGNGTMYPKFGIGEVDRGEEDKNWREGIVKAANCFPNSQVILIEPRQTHLTGAFSRIREVPW